MSQRVSVSNLYRRCVVVYHENAFALSRSSLQQQQASFQLGLLHDPHSLPQQLGPAIEQPLKGALVQLLTGDIRAWIGLLCLLVNTQTIGEKNCLRDSLKKS